MFRIDGAAAGSAAVIDDAMIANHLPRTRPGAFGIELERGLQVVTRETRVVGAHSAEIPEFAANFIDAVRRRPFEDHAHRGTIGGHTELAIVLELHRTNDDDRSS